MGLFDRLRQHFVSSGNRPPTIQPGFSPTDPNAADSPETRESPNDHGSSFERLDDEIQGLSFAIEYRDANGQVSRRRIVMRSVFRLPDGRQHLTAYCFEQNAIRHFSLDHIQTVIDMDGVTHDTADFFRRELQVELDGRDAWVTTDKTPSQQRPQFRARPGVLQQVAARDGSTVLVALARADGFVAPEELDVILDYVEQRSASEGVTTMDADRDVLRSRFKRFRPDVDLVDEALLNLEDEAPESLRLFAQAATALVNADGVRDPAEIDMLTDIGKQLGIARDMADSSS